MPIRDSYVVPSLHVFLRSSHSDRLAVPDDYEETLSYYTHKGYRVIACATKHMERLSWVKSQKMKRSEVESDLDFVGFIIFENKLKPTTEAVLKELRQSNIGSIMVTGDNILTAISVARNCSLIDKDAHCFVPHFAKGNSITAVLPHQLYTILTNIHRGPPRP